MGRTKGSRENILKTGEHSLDPLRRAKTADGLIKFRVKIGASHGSGLVSGLALGEPGFGGGTSSTGNEVVTCCLQQASSIT